MGKIGNSKSSPDQSDIRPNEPQAITTGHKSGRRTSTGGSKTAGGPGMKEQFLTSARSTNKAHVKAFRSGDQDARSGATKAGNDPTGPVSTHPNTPRRGSGSAKRMPTPSGGA